MIQYKKIKGYERYEVGSDGSVWTRSWHNSGERRQLATHINGQGYVVIHLLKDGKPKFFQVHRLVAQTFISNVDSKEQVNHKDGNKQNNHIVNLEWSTRGENTKHSYDRLGRTRCTGLRNGHVVRSKQQLIDMYHASKQLSLKDFKAKFSGSKPMYYRLRNGSHWLVRDGLVHELPQVPEKL